MLMDLRMMLMAEIRRWYFEGEVEIMSADEQAGSEAEKSPSPRGHRHRGRSRLELSAGAVHLVRREHSASVLSSP
jgi:hypothetical protein